MNEETPDERGMTIKWAWQSIGILPIIAITHIATFVDTFEKYLRLAPFGGDPGDPRGNRYVSFPRSLSLLSPVHFASFRPGEVWGYSYYECNGILHFNAKRTDDICLSSVQMISASFMKRKTTFEWVLLSFERNSDIWLPARIRAEI